MNASARDLAARAVEKARAAERDAREFVTKREREHTACVKLLNRSTRETWWWRFYRGRVHAAEVRLAAARRALVDAERRTAELLEEQDREVRRDRDG